MELCYNEYVSRHIIALFMLLKVSGKVLFDRNTLYSPVVHRIHNYFYCSLLLLLFTMYMITVDCYIVPLLSLYRPNILDNTDFDCYNLIK